MCSNCSGDYEEPDLTAENEELPAIDALAIQSALDAEDVAGMSPMEYFLRHATARELALRELAEMPPPKSIAERQAEAMLDLLYPRSPLLGAPRMEREEQS